MRRCEEGVSVSIDDINYSVDPETIIDFFDNTVVPLLNEEMKKSQ
jgi:hypothetical protein